MKIELTDLTKEERLPLELKRLFAASGYRRFRMGKFEPYEMYQNNRHFIGSDSFITFTDKDGRLMALKPDVTLSIASGYTTREGAKKVYYLENIFRKERGGDYREIYQAGIEAIGDDGAAAEVVTLALHALSFLEVDFVLTVGSLGFVSALRGFSALSRHEQKTAMRLIGAKNAHELDAFLYSCGVDAPARAEVNAVTSVSGDMKETLLLAKKYASSPEAKQALDELTKLYASVKAAGLDRHVRLDFSLMNDLSYYNGIVFQGYIASSPRAVLVGGRYDNMMKRLKKDVSAVGFALRLSDAFVEDGE